MKKGELYDFYSAAPELSKSLSGRKWIYQFNKNLRHIERLIKKWDKEEREPSFEYKKFIDAIEEVKRKHALKDDKGKFVIKEGTDPNGNPAKFYDIPGIEEPESEVRKQIDSIRKKNKKLTEVQRERERVFYEEFLEEEVTKEEFTPGLVTLDEIIGEYTDDIDKLVYWMVAEQPKKEENEPK